MTKEAIIAEASKMETIKDLLNLLNKVKMSELGEKGYPFKLPHLNYFIHPARNKKSYKTFQIPKKSGGVRKISAPKNMLKSFLTYANKILQAFYEAPDYVTGFVPGKSVVDNAERHLGMNYVFNTDLKDFFPSISKSRVWATLKHLPFNFNDTIADAVAGLCCTEVTIDGEKRRVLPQGSPASPILTNIVCRNLDRQLYKLARKYNLHYSRYADDITFSGNRNVFQKGGAFQQELGAIISGQQFTINNKKTRLQKKNERQEVTGLIVSDRANVSRRYVRWLDNLLHIWEKYGEADAYFRFVAHYVPKMNFHRIRPNMQSVVQGRLQYLKMVKGVDSEVWRRLQRRYNKLVGLTSPPVEATIKFQYLIKEFEKKTGVPIDFGTDDNGVVHCSFSLNDKRIPVALSKYARTRVQNILKKNDSEELNIFKSCYQILLFEGVGISMWRIERMRKWQRGNHSQEEKVERLEGAPTILGPEEVNVWPLLEFAKMKGKMQVGSFVNKTTGDTFKSCIFTDKEDNRIFVSFSTKLGELTPSEIVALKNELVVRERKDGKYILCRNEAEQEDLSTHSSNGEITNGKSTDEILASLISSNYNLNVLDEWDKTKSS